MTDDALSRQLSPVAASRGDAARWLVSGVTAGVISAAGLTIARWGTSEPYSPLLIPYDATLFVSAGAGAFLLSAILVRPRFGAIAARATSTGLVVALLAAIWVSNVAGTGGGIVLKVFGASLLATFAVLFLRNILRGREGGWFIGWFCLTIALSLSFSLVAYQVWKASALLFPVAITFAISSGVPRLPRIVSRHNGVPLAAATVITVFCGSTVFPWSGQLIDATSAVPPGPAPSVILIVLDTLRQDHMSLYGYERPTTPNLDDWAKDALVFDDASAATSWTLPSHASIFTGLAPRTHGAHGFRGTGPPKNARPLPGERVTLAEIASEAGYATAAVAANTGYLTRSFGLDQGFDTYWVPAPRGGARFAPSDILAQYFSPWEWQEFRWSYYRARYITDNAIRWLDVARDRPFFLFINYMDVHTPNARRPSPELPLEEETPFTVHKYDFDRVMAGTESVAPSVLRDLVNNYDRELVYLDRELGRLLDYIGQSGLSTTTSILITSDHGEYLGEHNLFQHGMHLNEEVVRVPLLLKGPGVLPGRTSRLAQSVDIFRTAIDLMAIPYEGVSQGTSLLEGTPRPVVSELYVAQQRFPAATSRYRLDRDVRTIRTSRNKLFLYEDDSVELYDIQLDPQESDDLSERRPDIVAELRARLEKWLLEHPEAELAPGAGAPKLTPEDLARLRALGYIR